MSEEKGLIFHIIHGSFVDGPGVRTTVFLKGCPLRCLWCCNPEGQATHQELKYERADCNGCGRCIAVCPEQAITAGGDSSKPVIIDREKCTRCMKCVDVCYTEALGVFGEYYTVDELFALVKNDRPFYESTGGGVTIGGGEPSAQAEFTLAFLKKCRQFGIHTAVDSCGYTISSAALRVLEEADMVLLDIKGMDADMHSKYTGVSNKRIHDNLRRLEELGKPVIIRIPLIPDITDTETELEKMAEFLSGFRCIQEIDLLPYHEYGKAKHEQLGMKYALSCDNYKDEQLDRVREVFARYGLKTHDGG